MDLNFKFDEATADDQKRLFAGELKAAGADTVKPLFPGTTESELKALYRVSASEEKVARVLERLSNSRLVEFAEPDVERKLVTPKSRTPLRAKVGRTLS